MSTGVRESERVTPQGVHEEWADVELWEKLEQRHRRRMRALYIVTAGVVLLLSALPPIFERSPKWRALNAARILGQELNELKREAAVKRMALTVSFRETEAGGIDLEIAATPKCSTSGTPESIRREPLSVPKNVAWLRPETAANLGIQGIVSSFCVDPLAGFFSEGKPLDPLTPPLGIALIPREDLAEARVDRIALLTVRGSLGEFAFR